MVTSTTQQKILEVGKKEFLKEGFRNTSLRKIVKEAGFTVGAFYGYYPNKEALFNAIVEEPARLLWEKYLKTEQRFFEITESGQIDAIASAKSREELSWINDMVEDTYENYDAFKLIFCRSAGTAYEGYLDQLAQAEIEDTQKFILLMEKHGQKPDDMDDKLIHILVSSLFRGIYEIFDHDMPHADALRYAKKLQEYHTAGWLKLLGL
jgi:AcrR family transcriptional regulator